MRKLVVIGLLCGLVGNVLNARSPLGEEGKAPWFALKTNAIYWATATPNVGVEFRLAPRWSLEAEVGLNPFTGKDDDGAYGKSIKHFRLHPEARYWFCETFYGHFLGLHVIMYPISTGWALAASVTRAGAPAWASATATTGYWASIGTWRPPSAWAIFTWSRTRTRARVAAGGSTP